MTSKLAASRTYRRKLRQPADAVAAIASGAQVFCASNALTPMALIDALAARADALTDVHVIHLLLLADNPLSRPEMAVHFRHTSLFAGHGDREAINDGRADAIPVSLKDIPRLFAERHLPLDWALVSVSPPDEHGYMSFGLECLATLAACHHATRLVAQVNRMVPRVLGDCHIHVDQVDAIVECDAPLFTVSRRQPSVVELGIGQQVRTLIHDGATLQMGIGGIPDAVYASLGDLNDLGIHSEMISDGAMQAIQQGVVTGRRKTLHPDKVILTFALGSAELYQFLDDNPLIESHPVDYVNDPFVIGQNRDLVSINSAIEVDLTGQVCADSIGERIYSGFGGQLDFARGAARSPGGKAIIALPSTAEGGQISRIAPRLKPGAGVVTTRADVQYVATEHGVAHLFGRSFRQRAEALIAVAHPDFRAELRQAARARRLFGLGPDLGLPEAPADASPGPPA